MSKRYWKSVAIVLIIALSATGCIRKAVFPPKADPPPKPKPIPKPIPVLRTMELERTGFTIQAGAFADPNNAIKLALSLNRQNLDAYYFVHESGLFKVRFGDFPSRKEALNKAKTVRLAGIIEEFYIVSPTEFAVIKEKKYGKGYLREELVDRAESFIGLPYQWGGSSPEDGFDCSGLTMSVYRLIGLNLPHSSKEQFKSGAPIKKSDLNRGDLVFFSTAGGNKISHVGIYAGDDKFIHAPGKDKRIRFDFLSSTYYKKRYAGARKYLD